ncbi:MAG: tRNA-dihydrouridine synthase family protein, partial [Clostridia bacterium]|nr:tRNA-dihydrouridine synthase family protein [Clostridia bacterium]
MAILGFDKIPIILAPMAGVTDHAFRIICAEHGADMCVTEMISAKAVQFNDKKTYELARIHEDECPCALQLFGSEPDIIADSARALLSHARNGNGNVPVMLDINMGCPVKKVAGNGEGSALMKTPSLVGEIVRKTAESVDIPVSVKIRAGWDLNSKNAPEIASIAEANGASLISVHGRTRSQMYTPG